MVSLAPLLDAADQVGPPSPETESASDARISQDLWDLLDRAGDQRFWSKSEFFSRLLEEETPAQARNDQLLFEGLMEGLGYKANQQAFLSLAQRALAPSGGIIQEPA